MRLRKKPWIKDEILGYTTLIVENPKEVKGHWQGLFANSNPIYAEFGTGRGRFITTLAKNNPNRNYIALEQKQEVLVQGMRRAINMELTNIRFILGNANYLEEFFSENELSRIYLNFVDPWPKKRHEKRRLTHKKYLDVYKKILNKNGEIHLKTDNEILFEFSLNEFLKNELSLHQISLNLYREEGTLNEHVQTEYEQQFITKGKPIYRVEAAKYTK